MRPQKKDSGSPDFCPAAQKTRLSNSATPELLQLLQLLSLPRHFSLANGHRRRVNHQTPARSINGLHKNCRTPYFDFPPLLGR